MTTQPKNILSVFAGRQRNIDLQSRYLTKAIERGIIDEVHYWDYSRNAEDRSHLRKISNLRRTTSVNGGDYVVVNTPVVDGTFSVNVRTSGEITIKLDCGGDEIEIVLGVLCLVIKGKEEIYRFVEGVSNATHLVNYQITISNGILSVICDSSSLFTCDVGQVEPIDIVSLKTCSQGEVSFKALSHDNFFYLQPCTKDWTSYYNYYNTIEFKDDIIIKCDDDICFIDLDALPAYIEFVRKNEEHDLIFANVVNNGVAAYYQQRHYHLIPDSLMTLEYPPRGLCGSLWASGDKAGRLHKHFIANHQQFIDRVAGEIEIPIWSRFSINFFAYKGCNWHKIANCGEDDETALTHDYVHDRHFKNIMYSGLIVAHMSFYKQIETGFNTEDILHCYTELADKYLPISHFEVSG